MVKIKKERLYKLHCKCCDSREKVLAILSNGDREVGFTTICCNCGNVQRFVLRDYDHIMSSIDESNITSMLEGNFRVSELRCGTNQPYCPRKNCPYWDGSHHARYPEPGHYCEHHKPSEDGENSSNDVSIEKPIQETIKRYL